MNTEILKIALRQNALYLPFAQKLHGKYEAIGPTTASLVANCNSLGFDFSEPALHAVNALPPTAKLDLLNALREVSGVRKNWTPLVKQWDIPTGETRFDHLVTWFANIFPTSKRKGTTLPCGHLIPFNTFPIDRYNGCPFCGTPFSFETLDIADTQISKLKTLVYWSDAELQEFFESLLASPVALDATQVDSLKVLLKHVELPQAPKVAMKETLMVLIDALIEQDKASLAGRLFTSPNDVLRYLWYKHTGYLQIIRPGTILKRSARNAQHRYGPASDEVATKLQTATSLKLKYSRAECRRYAEWLNALPMDVRKQAEIMHPKREMWVRIIRALRLAEYSKRKGFEKLAQLLDVFYNEDYEVWQGHVEQYKLKMDADATFSMLQERPGLFARSLFASMLWFGAELTLQYFREVMHAVPPRLIFTLNMYADIYFNRTSSRSVKPLGGTNKRIPANRLLQLYSDKQLVSMREAIRVLTLDVIKAKLAKTETESRSLYIAKELEHIPLSIGDRSDHIQDLPAVPSGTRFPVEGNTVRLFLQWGEGLPAQHLDMDLSCLVAYEDRVENCSYSRLVITGCKHSGDIQRIPHKIGTAEYIDVDVDKLRKEGARYVTFTCNAYTTGAIAPNVVVGWMNSKHPMTVTSRGVAYNPTHVQHQVRIKQSMDKGLVFGVLDVRKNEVIWLEMSFGGQVVGNLSTQNVEALLQKLQAKLMLAPLLQMKADVQQLQIVDDPDLADEVYDLNWALNSTAVSTFFLG
ncbi:MAG: hypothetical protein AB8F95_21330 [Bacteroidia bacterium]